MTLFPSQFLPWINNLNSSQTLGLFNGSLYEVLNDDAIGNGKASVSAIGFNITCGYLLGVIHVSTMNLGTPSDNMLLDLGPLGRANIMPVTKGLSAFFNFTAQVD